MNEEFDYSKENLMNAVKLLEKDFHDVARLIDLYGYDPELLSRLLSAISLKFGFDSFDEFQYKSHAFEPAAQETIFQCEQYLLAVFLNVDRFKGLLQSYCESFESDINNASWELSFDLYSTFMDTSFKAVIKHFDVTV